MEKMKVIILLFLEIQTIDSINYKVPSQNGSYSLNSNLIVNSNISTPVIHPAYYADYANNQSGWTTKVKFIQYIDACLEQQSNILACPTFRGVSCGWQFLDTDSTNSNQQYYQRFTLSAGLQLMLQIDWISQASFFLSSTGFSVIWNGVTIDSIYDNTCTLQTSTYYLISIAGVNQVVIAGIGFIDSAGILVRNIQLKQIIYSNSPTNTTNTTNTTTNTSNNSTTNTTTTNTSNNNSPNSNPNSNNTNTTNTTTNTTTTTTNISTAGPTNSTNSTILPNISFSNSINSSPNVGINGTNQTNTTSNSSTPSYYTAIANQSIINGTLPTTTLNSSMINHNLTIPNQTNANLPLLPFQDISFNFDTLENYLNSTQYKQAFKILYFMKNFEIGKLVNTVSVLKQNAKFIFGFILQFNHLLLYNYHLLNCTMMSNIILTGMQALSDQKGYFLDTYIYPFFNISPEEINSGFEQQNNLPLNINNLFSDFMHRPNGIFLQFTDILFLELPMTLVIFALGYFMFSLVFKWKVSIVFRQYSITGCFFYVLLDGKIEMITFFFLSEALMLTCPYFSCKLKVVAIVFIYFFVFTFAVASMLLFKAKYGKLVRYIYQNCKKPNRSVPYMTFGYGLYNLLLGFAHRMLLSTPQLQLYALIAIESAYLIYLLVLLARRHFENLLIAATLCAMNLARLIFILTFLIFQLLPSNEDRVSLLQEYFLYTFLSLWSLSSLFSLLEKLIIFFKAVAYECKRSENCNRIRPTEENFIEHIQPQYWRMSFNPTLTPTISITKVKPYNFGNKLIKKFFKRDGHMQNAQSDSSQRRQKQNSTLTVSIRKRRVLKATINKMTFTIK